MPEDEDRILNAIAGAFGSLDAFTEHVRRILVSILRPGNEAYLQAENIPEEPEAAVSVPVEQLEEGLMKNLCLICAEVNATMVIIPCGHQCCCKDCVEKMETNLGDCPVCRTEIERFMQVFRAGLEVSSKPGGQIENSD